MLQRVRLAGLVAAALAIVACSKKESGTDTTAASSTSSTDTSAMAAGAQGTSGNWTDENVFALLDEANMADSAAGAVAATKGTASAVRDFGKQMMSDHHTLHARGEALAKKLKITPAPPSDDPVTTDAQQEMNTLNSTAKGKDFDKAYIDGEIDGHKKVLDLLAKAAQQTHNTQLKNLIQKAAPTVLAHLDKSEAIQKTLK